MSQYSPEDIISALTRDMQRGEAFQDVNIANGEIHATIADNEGSHAVRVCVFPEFTGNTPAPVIEGTGTVIIDPTVVATS